MDTENIINEKTIDEDKAVRLHWISEVPNYYCSYYQDEKTGGFYALMNFRSIRTWYTTTANGGEPDMPLENGTVIEIVADGQAISQEVITNVDVCTSIGMPVADPPETPKKPRRGNSKKEAGDPSGESAVG